MTATLDPRLCTYDVEALNARLDADPADHFTRLLLADALADAGAGLEAESCRWLATMERVPSYDTLDGKWALFGWFRYDKESEELFWKDKDNIPAVVFGSGWMMQGLTRRACEEAFYAAYASLTDAQRAELWRMTEAAT